MTVKIIPCSKSAVTITDPQTTPYVVDGCDDSIVCDDTALGATVTLPKSPEVGQSVTVISNASGGTTVTGGAFPMNGGNFLVPEGTSQTFVFSCDDTWVPEGPQGVSSAALAQAVWHINALTGNDANSGLTAGTALKTHAEFERRIGHYNTLTADTVDVFIDSDLPASDPINLIVILKAGGSQMIRYHGASTTTASGSMTAVTALNRATNQATEITTATALSVGDRLRVTSGAALDAIAWVAKSLGAGVYRTSAFATVPIFVPGDNTFTTAALPAPMDTFVVESLRKVYHGLFIVLTQAVNVGNVASVQFLDFDWQDADPSLSADAGIPDGAGNSSTVPLISYLRNAFRPTYLCTGAEVYLQNCLITNVSVVQTTFFVFAAGLSLANIRVAPGSNVEDFDFDFMIQGASLIVRSMAQARIGAACVFDSPGAGVQLEEGASIRNTHSAAALGSGITALYGSGNTDVGVHTPSGAALYLANDDLPTITGAVGDFDLGGLTNVQEYTVGSGSYAAPVVASWANLALAADTSLHNPAKNAHAIAS